jgi:hypothetical protein
MMCEQKVQSLNLRQVIYIRCSINGTLKILVPILPANVASSDHRCPYPAIHRCLLPLLEFSSSPAIKIEESHEQTIFIAGMEIDGIGHIRTEESRK